MHQPEHHDTHDPLLAVLTVQPLQDEGEELGPAAVLLTPELVPGQGGHQLRHGEPHRPLRLSHQAGEAASLELGPVIGGELQPGTGL